MGELVAMPARRDVEAGSGPLVRAGVLADHFDVTERTIRRWRELGMPSHGGRGRTRRYRISECEVWFAEKFG
jgi:phage terminase Nu1 subunit (DNA packaging protein)